MASSVDTVCNLLTRSRLLSAGDVQALRQRWLGEAKESAGDVGQFSRWLVANHYTTEYQAALLLRGHADHFFLDQYKLLDRIGKGRMAGVYKAVHHLGQVVAIKVLPPSKARDPQLLARFQREARLALRLKHPNVVRAFQVGEARGLHYLVLEYLEGETLDEVLRRRSRLPPPEAVRLIYQALLGLQHIHELGLVHRDLEPANLMLVPPRTAGMPDNTLHATVKILDIGLGRALFDETTPGAADNFQLTNEGALIGNPDYLAPEQARDAHKSDIRADIYSLGCVLYQALAGQPPFPDTNLVRQLVRHATETPRPLKELNPAVPEGLQQITDWMLAKDPAQRYPTPERAAQALQVFLAAGTEPARTAQVEPQIAAYLKWLETHASEAEAGFKAPAPPVTVVPVVSAAPAAQPVPKHLPATPPRARPTTKARPSTPRPTPSELPVVEEVEPAGSPTADVELVPAGPSKAPFLSRRDFFLLGIGVAVGVVALLVAEVIVWLIARLVQASRVA